MKNIFTVTKPETHTMGKYLFKYLEIKIHPLIDLGIYKKIIVVGNYNRARGISSKEKSGKLYNWQRPTAIIKNDILYIECFPGLDYVTHYASLITTYLALKGKPYNNVSYILPKEEDLWLPILNSNYSDLPITDGVIVGYGLPQIFEGLEWTEKLNYHFSKLRIGKKVYTLLLIKHSFWGDIGGRIVNHLAKLGHKRLIFIGKLGSLNKKHEPNSLIATGDETFVEGEVVRWKNIFQNMQEKNVVLGKHITIPSVILETKKWLSNVSKKYSFVDPEIGHMARSAILSRIEFSYLHIISDNVQKPRIENLSNERSNSVLNKRKVLFNSLKKTLTTYL